MRIDGRKFCWDEERVRLTGVCEGNDNLGVLATERNILLGRGPHTALIWRGEGQVRRELTYDELNRKSNCFANVLMSFGVGPKATVYYLGQRIPDILSVLLGCLKNRSIFCPLFESFGVEPVQHRLMQGDGVLLVCDSVQYEQKIRLIRKNLPSLSVILLVDTEIHPGDGVWSLPLLMSEADDVYTVGQTSLEEAALLHFTSGTTSLPKGALLPHSAGVCQVLTGRYVFNLIPGDIFWCTADPGWVTGTVYSLLTPLLLGATTLMDLEEFSVARWLEILTEERVNILYTSPSAIRRLQRVEKSAWHDVSLPYLRSIHSVGEPLDASSVIWGQNVLGLPIRDSWWQTETGAIMIANSPEIAIKPGSMGLPVPGITAEVIDAATGTPLSPGNTGLLALQAGWPSQFTGYIKDEARYAKCFTGSWYLSGDLAMRDGDGYFWFKGRSDDMIKSAGHLVSPFEVEVVLNNHPEILESAVFGVPDELLGEKVVAAVVAKGEDENNESLVPELIGFARRKLGPAVAPREIQLVQSIPKNRAGKIMRRVMRAEKIGETPGDLSTLAEPA